MRIDQDNDLPQVRHSIYVKKLYVTAYIGAGKEVTSEFV